MKEKEAASISEMSQLKTEVSSSGESLTARMRLFGTYINSIYEPAPLDKRILDSDGSVTPAIGDQGSSVSLAVVACSGGASRKISVL